jgi:Protein of unknown function (DUF1569)
MKTLFESSDRESLLARLDVLKPDSPRQWGKMNPAQALCHCAIAMEACTGVRPMKQKLIGKILMPFIKKSFLSEKPWSRNSPTDPSFIVADEREFAAERARLKGLIQQFVDRGPAAAGNETHAFFGKLTGQQWGEVMYKHVDHHLQQFGV